MESKEVKVDELCYLNGGGFYYSVYCSHSYTCGVLSKSPASDECLACLHPHVTCTSYPYSREMRPKTGDYHHIFRFSDL
jgi:hypothetical protein